jgi:hypothetical protein
MSWIDLRTRVAVVAGGAQGILVTPYRCGSCSREHQRSCAGIVDSSWRQENRDKVTYRCE